MNILTQDEWLALRKPTIGSSEAAAACGESPYKSAHRLVAEKRGVVADEFVRNERQKRRGRKLEAWVLEEYEIETGNKLMQTATEADRAAVEAALTATGCCEVIGWVESDERPQVFLRSIPWPWMTCTLDGVAQLAGGALEIVEAKSLGWRQIMSWGDEHSGVAPTVYRIQVLHALAVTRASSAALVATIGADAFRLVREDFDAPTLPLDSIVALEKEAIDAIRGEREPNTLSVAYDDVRRVRALLHPEDDGEVVKLDDAALALSERREELRAMRLESTREANALQAEEDQLSERIEALLGGHTFGELPDGLGRYEWKTWKRRGYSVAPTTGKTLTFKPKTE